MHCIQKKKKGKKNVQTRKHQGIDNDTCNLYSCLCLKILESSSHHALKSVQYRHLDVLTRIFIASVFDLGKDIASH